MPQSKNLPLLKPLKLDAAKHDGRIGRARHVAQAEEVAGEGGFDAREAGGVPGEMLRRFHARLMRSRVEGEYCEGQIALLVAESAVRQRKKVGEEQRCVGRGEGEQQPALATGESIELRPQLIELEAAAGE